MGFVTKDMTMKADYKVGLAFIDTKYKGDKLTTSVNADVMDKFTVGAQVVSKGADFGFPTFQLSYKDDGFTAISSVLDAGSKIRAEMFHIASDSLDAAMRWEYTLNGGKSTMVCGVAKKMQGDATGSLKLTSTDGKDAKLGMRYGWKLNPGVDALVKSEVDIMAPTANKFGFEIAFGADA